LKINSTHESDQRLPRIPYRVRVVMHPRESSESHEGEARDLSVGGMFIETILPLDPGTVFDIEIPMEPLSFRGAVRVLRTILHDVGADEPRGLAVEWVDMSTNQKRVLFRQIEDHVRGGGEILSGDPDAAVVNRPPARRTGASEVAVTDHTQLIVRLSIAAMLVLIALVMLLLP
jgi:hypothetical protein